MYIAAAITALLNLAEIVYIGPRRILNAFTCVKGMIPSYHLYGPYNMGLLEISSSHRPVNFDEL